MTEFNTLGQLNSSGWVHLLRELDIDFNCDMDLKVQADKISHVAFTKTRAQEDICKRRVKTQKEKTAHSAGQKENRPLPGEAPLEIQKGLRKAKLHKLAKQKFFAGICGGRGSLTSRAQADSPGRFDP